ncbi:MAG: GNAT family N-acetyltransferase [Rhodospirillales bacterium]
MSQDVTVRAPTRDDFDAWSHLWAGYNAFYERKGPTAVPAEITRLTWDRFFDAYEPMHCLVAEHGGKLVGLVHYIYHRNTVMRGPTCYLQDLFTDAALRGQGVGRALIEAVYARARAAGSPRVYWQTHETNTTAMTLYDKVASKSGFVVYRHDL